LVTLESDKATMEVPSAHAGVVKELKVKVGDTISEGGVVAVIEAAGAADEVAQPAPKAVPAAAPVPARAKEPDPVVEPVAVGDRPDRLAQASIDAQANRAPASGQPPVRFEADALIPGKVPYASPAVRLFARELGVDLSRIAGTEKGGRITKEDVQKYVKGALAGGTTAAAGVATG